MEGGTLEDDPKHSPCLDTSCIPLHNKKHHLVTQPTDQQNARILSPNSWLLQRPMKAHERQQIDLLPHPEQCFIPGCDATANPTRHPHQAAAFSLSPFDRLVFPKSLWRHPRRSSFRMPFSGSLAESICPFEVHDHVFSVRHPSLVGAILSRRQCT